MVSINPLSVDVAWNIRQFCLSFSQVAINSQQFNIFSPAVGLVVVRVLNVLLQHVVSWAAWHCRPSVSTVVCAELCLLACEFYFVCNSFVIALILGICLAQLSKMTCVCILFCDYKFDYYNLDKHKEEHVFNNHD